jgi:hypothetical protein
MAEKDKEIESVGMGDLSDGRKLIPMGEMGAEDREPDEIDEILDPEHVLVLKRPIKIAGVEFKRLEFDFDELTAKDLHKASKYLKNLGIPVSVPALDFEYQLVLFTYAVRNRMRDVEMNDLMRLSAADTSKATGLARDFLLDKDPGLKDLGSDE